MAKLRKEAQKKARLLKRKYVMRNYQLATLFGVRDSELSRVITGNGYVSDNVCQKIIDKEEPSK